MTYKMIYKNINIFDNIINNISTGRDGYIFDNIYSIERKFKYKKLIAKHFIILLFFIAFSVLRAYKILQTIIFEECNKDCE